MKVVDVQRLEALERVWDARLGGPESRPYRDLLCYCAGRLLAHGALFEGILGYLGDSFDEAVELMKGGTGGDA